MELVSVNVANLIREIYLLICCTITQCEVKVKLAWISGVCTSWEVVMEMKQPLLYPCINLATSITPSHVIFRGQVFT